MKGSGVWVMGYGLLVRLVYGWQRVSDFRFGVLILGFGFRVSGFGFKLSDFGVLISGIQGIKNWDLGLGFKVPGCGFMKSKGFGLQVLGFGGYLVTLLDKVYADLRKGFGLRASGWGVQGLVSCNFIQNKTFL